MQPLEDRYRAGFGCRWPGAFVGVVLGVALAVGGCGGGDKPPLNRQTLLDATACKECHPTHYTEWAGSMHAYASEDPVFLAMNARGQRETGGALGDFCVKCHAPVAVREGATKDGLNLGSVSPSLKGVTCYFCHSVAEVRGVHDNPLVLATDGSMFGGIVDPDTAPHASKYSANLDSARAESAATCGSCHDIVNQHGAHLERTYQEWQSTLFAQPSKGLTCGQCHMTAQQQLASTVSHTLRKVHSHTFAAVDTALTDWPGVDVQKKEIQTLLDTTLQATLCTRTDGKIEVTLDNVGAGHAWPSGASQDRRAWVEVIAYKGDVVTYQTGVPLGGKTPEPPADPALWLIRDCIYDQTGADVKMFWQAAEVVSNQLPGSIPLDPKDRSTFTFSHIKKVFPGGGTGPAAPDRITMRVRLRPMGEDVLQDLVASGDLDPSLPERVPVFELGGTVLEWTAATAQTQFNDQRELLLCVGSGNYLDTPNIAVSHATCVRP